MVVSNFRAPRSIPLLILAVALPLALPLLLRGLAGRRLCALELGGLSLASHRGIQVAA